MAGQPKRRLFKLLRRTVRSAKTVVARNTEDDSALWAAHHRALTDSRQGLEAAQRVASALAKQRAATDAAQDRARALTARANETAHGARKILELFERLGLVALNAGLEGARLGEGPGKSLTVVGDEVRDHSARGGDASREFGVALSECAAELVQVTMQLDRVREASVEAAQDAARAGEVAQDAERALLEMAERMKKATGSDPETARFIADAMDHARALVLSLSQVTGKVPRGTIVAALRPVLEPLARLLESDEAGEGDEVND